MHTPYTDDFRRMIAKEYNSGKSLSELKKLYNVSFKFITDNVKKFGYKVRGISEGMKKFSINDKFFEQILMPEQAQILGFIYADGCLARASKYTMTLNITINTIDLEYLVAIKNNMNYDAPIKIFRNGEMCSLNTHNRKIIQDIQKLGVHSRKSLNLDWPALSMVPDHLINSFLLGYYEGDGSFYFCPSKSRQPATLTICGTQEFLTKLAQIIKERFDINSYLYQKPKHKKANINTFVLKIGGNQQAMKIMDWMYESKTSFLMERKVKKYQLFRQRYDQNRILKPEFAGIYSRN